MRLKAIWILCALALGAFALGAAGCGGGGTTTVTVAVDTTSTDTTVDGHDVDRHDVDRHDRRPTTTETTTETETTTTRPTPSRPTRRRPRRTTTTPDLSFISNENCREFVQFASDFSQALSGTGDTDIQERGRRDAGVRRRGAGRDQGRLPGARRRVLEDRRRARRRRPELGQDAVGGRDREAGPALAGDRHDQADRGEHRTSRTGRRRTAPTGSTHEREREHRERLRSGAAPRAPPPDAAARASPPDRGRAGRARAPRRAGRPPARGDAVLRPVDGRDRQARLRRRLRRVPPAAARELDARRPGTSCSASGPAGR